MHLLCSKDKWKEPAEEQCFVHLLCLKENLTLSVPELRGKNLSLDCESLLTYAGKNPCMPCSSLSTTSLVLVRASWSPLPRPQPEPGLRWGHERVR